VLIDTGAGNAILYNSIFDNAHSGIELRNNGNNNLTAPRLTSARAGGGDTVVQGSFTGRASTTYTLDVFTNADASPQGGQFLGELTVTTDEAGQATVTFDVGAELPLGQLVTATATDPGNDTSAFSQAVAVTN
jgi:parallel beta-helix repeat protein